MSEVEGGKEEGGGERSGTRDSRRLAPMQCPTIAGVGLVSAELQVLNKYKLCSEEQPSQQCQ